MKEAKYNNHKNNFILKLTIFHNIYSRVYILFETKIKTYFTMLKSLIYDYYYKNISTNSIIINLD